jgi:hypothetical protein
MTQRFFAQTLTAAVALAASLALACGQDSSPSARSAKADGQDAAVHVATAPAAHAEAHLVHAHATAATFASTASTTTAAPATAARTGAVAFTGTREETERFIGYYQAIRLTPEQERIKVQALSTIPAPCCAENPLATCCCPCNMAKAAWGLSAWLITEKGYGVEQLNQAAKDWLAAANPDGFSGNACHNGGCARPIHKNGCGGMNDTQVL